MHALVNSDGMERFSLKDVTDLGFSLAYFTRLSGLSFRALKRLDANEPGVRPDTKAKAARALAVLKDEVQRRNTRVSTA